jgi:hypothetical protein
MRQSAAWRAFKRNAAEQSLDEAQIRSAPSLAVEAASVLRQAEAPEFINPVLPGSLEELANALETSGDTSPPDVIDAGKELLAADVIESVNNTLKRIAEVALAAAAVSRRAGGALSGVAGDYAKRFGGGFEKAARRQAPKDGEKAFKWLRRLAITGVAGGAGAGAFAQLAQLIAKYPEAFGWLERVLHYIK